MDELLSDNLSAIPLESYPNFPPRILLHKYICYILLGVTNKLDSDMAYDGSIEVGWSWLRFHFGNDYNYVEFAFRQRGPGKKVRTSVSGDKTDWVDF